MKLYFVNNATNEVIQPITGKYGKFAKYYGNTSEKKMLEIGFELIQLSNEEVAEFSAKRKMQKEKEVLQIFNEKLADRALQVQQSLEDGKIEITPNGFYGQTNTNVVCVAKIPTGSKAYHGCGEGMAYVKDNCVIAWHYGFNVIPTNLPADSEPVKVSISCFEICF